ncbi:MAG TPA: hypothetical protein VEI26_04540 [Terriglobales bacterium]|nr:hypothetical protein [Terriglobales bacterium]
MRLVSLCCALLMFCGLAAAQATIVGGHASNWLPSYGVFVGPYVPLITTPEVSLSTVSPWSAGASNSAFGLVAGAVNSTMSDEFVGEPPAPVYTQPVWYGQTEAELTSPLPYAGPPHPIRRKEAEREQAFDFVATPRASRESVAVLMRERGMPKQAGRTYTNQDVERMNQSNGLVKYDGKTEHI